MGCCIKLKKVSNVDFICPECGTIQPEILNINVDNKKIEFQCMKCAENEYNSHNFNEISDINKTCYYCKIAEEDGSNKYWLKIDKTLNHEIKENILENIISKDKMLKENIEIIKKKNEQLKKIIKFNKIIEQSCEIYKNNYLYSKSFENVYKSFEREKLRDSNELKFLFTAFNNDIEISNGTIEKLSSEKDIKNRKRRRKLTFK